MKILGILLLLVMASPVCFAATACICSCDPAEIRLCAPSYDIDNPCPAVCPRALPWRLPLRTACPAVEAIHPLTGRRIWVLQCPQ
jgi:hypothetical protein